MRRGIWIGLGAVALVTIGAIVFLTRPVTGPERDFSTLTADTAHGDYLIRLGSCVACHTDTASEGAFLAGGAAIQSPFGDFFAPNITSDPDFGIGNWSLEDFARAMSDGIRPDGASYYPAFPYAHYTLMSDQDIADLYAALMTVSPVARSAPDHDLGFPFSVRAGLPAWKNLFFSPARFEPDPSRSDLWNRGAYVVNGPGHCGACHTPTNMLGAPQGAPLSGGEGPDITPSALFEIGYDHEWMVEVLMGGVTPAFDIPGGSMADVIAHSTTHWTQADLDAAAAYLLDLDEIPH